MATIAQKNAAVNALRDYAKQLISEKVPGIFQGEADSYLTDAELLGVIDIIVKAIEG